MERSRDLHGIQMLRLMAFHLQTENPLYYLPIPSVTKEIKQVQKNLCT